MVDPKYSIANPHPEQTFCGQIVRLQDTSTVPCSTDSLEDFLKAIGNSTVTEYSLSDVATMVKAEFDLFAGPESVKAFASPVKPRRDLRPVYELKLKTHPRLQAVIQSNKRAMEPPEAEEFLRRLRDGLDAEGKALLLRMRDLKLSKKLEIEQKKEKNGNYSYSQKLESGPEDWTPPERITVRVPAFNFIQDEIAIPLDVVISLRDVGEGKEARQAITVRFECLDLEEHLLNGRRAIVTKCVEGHPCVWGELNLHVADDSWSVVHNHAEGVERLK